LSLFGADQGLYWFVVFALLAVVSGLLFLMVPLIFAPRRRSSIKEETFEAGQLPPGAKRIRFALQYYAYLLLFLVFDVEARSGEHVIGRGRVFRSVVEPEKHGAKAHARTQQDPATTKP
jgi:hypothetical protein